MLVLEPQIQKRVSLDLMIIQLHQALLVLETMTHMVMTVEDGHTYPMQLYQIVSSLVQKVSLILKVFTISLETLILEVLFGLIVKDYKDLLTILNHQL